MRVQIARFDPETKRNWQQVYQIEDFRVKGMTVMDLLAYIQWHLDPTLAYFQHSTCGHGICGRCVLAVNGKICLACLESVEGLTSLVLEPVPWRKVVRDLVTEDRPEERRVSEHSKRPYQEKKETVR